MCMTASLQYGTVIIKWQKSEAMKMDAKTRKLLIVHPKLRHQYAVLILKKGWEKLDQLPDFIKAEENSFGWYIKNTVKPMLKCTKMIGIIKTENCVIKEKFNGEMNTKKKKKIMEGKKCTVSFQEMWKSKQTQRTDGWRGMTWR